MKHYRMKDKKGLTKWIMLAGMISTLVTIVTVLVSRVLEQRMILKITRCADSLQKALPAIEQASELYIEANMAKEELIEPE